MVSIINSLQSLPRGVIYGLVGFLYVSAIILIRWNLIAVPLRQHLSVAIDSMKARLKVAVFGKGYDDETNADEQIEQLLEDAKKQLETSVWDKIFWSRGREMNGWRYVHAAGRLMSMLYPPEVVEARLRRARSELKSIPSNEASDLAITIDEELKAGCDADIRFRRALLNGALATIYDARDNKYNELDTWDNEAVWMITSGLLLIAVLGYAAGNSILFVVGAAGGLLGRLTHLFKVRLGSTDYGLYWDPLFIAPVLGALTGWTGVLMVTFMGGLGLKIEWYEPYPKATTLALAFLFGLSERFFAKFVTQAELNPIMKSDEDGSRTLKHETITK